MDAWASEYDRTKMTLQLVLASLYPPKQHQVWHDGVPWQPIPYKSPSKEQDQIFLAFLHNQLAVDEYHRELKLTGPRVLEPYGDLIKYVEKHSGLKIENPRIMFAIACTLGTQVGFFVFVDCKYLLSCLASVGFGVTDVDAKGLAASHRRNSDEGIRYSNVEFEIERLDNR